MKSLIIASLLVACISALGSKKWVLGPQRDGNCEEICKTNYGTCDESMGEEAASAPNSVDFEGIGCKGRNGWDYGQGFSQCLDKGCCGDSSCQFHCSATSRWPGCKIDNGNDALQHHGRLCPCRIPDCPDGWTLYGVMDGFTSIKCYKFFSKKTSWNKAKEECERNGDALASITEQKINDFITGTLLKHIPDNTPYHQVYIGGEQLREGGYTRDHWSWSGGYTLNLTNWMDNIADGGNEDCMSMLLKNDASNVRGKWNDVQCDKDNWLPFICEKDAENQPFINVIFVG